MITEADILAEIFASSPSGLAPEAARSILELKLSARAAERIRELLDKNNRGSISDLERSELDKYQRVGQFLDLLQAKARVSLAGDATD